MSQSQVAYAVPTKPSFKTQANALLRKNARYQCKNWCALAPRSQRVSLGAALKKAHRRLGAPCFCLHATRGTNLCLVLTPLTFSVVLGSASALRACLHCSPGSDLQPTTAPPLPASPVQS